MSRDTNSSLEPQIIRTRQRRPTGIGAMVLTLTAKGLTTGEVAAHFADVYTASVLKDTLASHKTLRQVDGDDRRRSQRQFL